MQLSISNIAWDGNHDEKIYEYMKKYGYTGLEIAPTRVFTERPYEDLVKAHEWQTTFFKQTHFVVPSMQSIWYGRQEKVFGTLEERKILLNYTKKAIDFAKTIQCKNLVLGCPKNRVLPDGMNEQEGVKFFKELSDYAYTQGTVIGMEANPPIYGTNYINDTVSALELIKQVESEGFMLNLDVGTMIQNKEPVEVLEGYAQVINHVHISEPGLKIVEKRMIHQELASFLKENEYRGFVSIEVGRQDDIRRIEDMLCYVKEIFG